MCLQIRELYVSLLTAPVPVELVISSCVGAFKQQLNTASQDAWPVGALLRMCRAGRGHALFLKATVRAPVAWAA